MILELHHGVEICTSQSKSHLSPLIVCRKSQSNHEFGNPNYYTDFDSLYIVTYPRTSCNRCIPYRLVGNNKDQPFELENSIEVLMISSPNRDDLVFPKVPGLYTHTLNLNLLSMRLVNKLS